MFMERGALAEHTPVAEFFTQPRTAAAQQYLKGE
jgi:ABC-type phosphate transport system ATPase subunit